MVKICADQEMVRHLLSPLRQLRDRYKTLCQHQVASELRRLRRHVLHAVIFDIDACHDLGWRFVAVGSHLGGIESYVDADVG